MGDQKVPFEKSNDVEDDDDEKEAEYFDCVCDLKKKLKDNKRLFVSQPFMAEKDKGSDALKGQRISDLFGELRQEMSKKYENPSMQQTYPRRHRFVSVVDRRVPEQKENDKHGIISGDELVMFEPTEDCNKFPKGKHVPMFYFETSRKSIIPGYDVKMNAEQKDKMQKGVINALDPANGGLMTLSFHVESTDEIRCYLFYNGQMLRFLPEDIVLVLPIFFDPEFGDNKTFAKSQFAKDLIEIMKGVKRIPNMKGVKGLKDVHFNSFLKQNRTLSEM